MRVKVISEFTDKHTNKRHSSGEEFECTKERLEEIQKVSKKLVTCIDAPAEDAKATVPVQGDAETAAKDAKATK